LVCVSCGLMPLADKRYLPPRVIAEVRLSRYVVGRRAENDRRSVAPLSSTIRPLTHTPRTKRHSLLVFTLGGKMSGVNLSKTTRTYSTAFSGRRQAQKQENAKPRPHPSLTKTRLSAPVPDNVTAIRPGSLTPLCQDIPCPPTACSPGKPDKARKSSAHPAAQSSGSLLAPSRKSPHTTTAS
jgi:hypothetical protein